LSVRQATVIFYILASDADVWARYYFFWIKTCFPQILYPHKQHQKIHKKYEQFLVGNLVL
jgi:hypothetical protein